MLWKTLKKIENVDDLKKYFFQKIESHPKWSIYQFRKGEDQPSEWRELFPPIPTPLVIDFFVSNQINNCRQITDCGNLLILATGIDDIQWEYELIPSSE